MQSCVLLNVRQLLESSIAVCALVGFLSCMNSDMLNELMIAAEALQTLLTLVGFNLATHSTTGSRRSVALNVARMLHLHRTFMHENLRMEESAICRSRRRKFFAKLNQSCLPLICLAVLRRFEDVRVRFALTKKFVELIMKIN